MIRKSIASVALLCLLVPAVPILSQQFQNKAEYDAYMALYNEQDQAIKVELGEDFVATYSESEAAPIAYQLLVATHYAQRDWRSLVDVSKRFDRSFPDAAAETKSFIYTRAMAAAQQERSPIDILDFGDKILELDRNHLGALLTLPPVILDNLPEFGSARETNLARAFELANRARVRAQDAYPIANPDPQQATERVQVFSRIYLYLGQVHEFRGDDRRAATEYARILNYDPRSSDAYLRLGLSFQRQAAEDSGLLQQALENTRLAALATPADDEGTAAPEAGDSEVGEEEVAQVAITELDPESSALEQAVLQNLDLAIDYLASAAALGGLAADLARVELDRLYIMRHENDVDDVPSLDDLISDKRSEISALQ